MWGSVISLSLLADLGCVTQVVTTSRLVDLSNHIEDLQLLLLTVLISELLTNEIIGFRLSRSIRDTTHPDGSPHLPTHTSCTHPDGSPHLSTHILHSP